MGFLTNLIPGLSLPKLAIFGALALAIAGCAGYLWWHNSQQLAKIAADQASIAGLTRDVATIAASNANYAAANQTLQVQNATDETELAWQANQAQLHVSDSAQALRGVSDAPASADTPAPPVAIQVLQELAQGQGQHP